MCVTISLIYIGVPVKSGQQDREKKLNYIQRLEDENQRLKQERKQLLEQRGQLRLSLEISCSVLWCLDLETWALDCSPEMLQMLGYQSNDLNMDLNQLRSLHRPDQWDNMNLMLKAHITKKIPVYQHEHEVYTKDRGWIWVSARGRVVYDPVTNEPIRLVGILMDIDEQMHREHSLHAEIKQLTGIIPICSSCKKIRNDSGYWERVEAYFETHTEIQFSHSLCHECVEELYGSENWFKRSRYQAFSKEVCPE